MRDLMLILESVRYDRFMEADAPNMKSLGKLCLGYAHATWTRPSISSIFTGYLPRTEEYGVGPYSPTYRMLDRYMLREDVPAYFFNSNAYAHAMEPRNYIEHYYELKKIDATKGIVADAKTLMESLNQFFVAVFLIESHLLYTIEDETVAYRMEWAKLWADYIKGVDNNAVDVAKDRQKTVVSWLDKQIKPLLPLADRIIVLADHGDLQGEHHKIGHGCEFPFHPKLLEVPVILSGF